MQNQKKNQKRIPARQRKTYITSIRLSQDERKTIKAAARAVGIGPSSYIARSAVLAAERRIQPIE